MDKGVETVVGFMGAVYAGCAYSQLNLRHPAPRVRAMLETLDTPIVVTNRAHLAQLEDINPPRAFCSSKSWKKRRLTRTRFPSCARR